MTKFNLFILALFGAFAPNSADEFGQNLSAEDLLELKEDVVIVDFRGEEAHDLDGLIMGSIPVPDTIDENTENKLR